MDAMNQWKKEEQKVGREEAKGNGKGSEGR